MGGFGSGRSGGLPTVESAPRLDIDSMMRWGAIRPGSHRVGGMRLHQLYGDELYQSSDRVIECCPVAAPDGHNLPGLVDECVASVAAVVDDIVEGFENPV